MLSPSPEPMMDWKAHSFNNYVKRNTVEVTMKKKDEDENSDNVPNYFPAHCIMYNPFTKKNIQSAFA